MLTRLRLIVFISLGFSLALLASGCSDDDARVDDTGSETGTGTSESSDPDSLSDSQTETGSSSESATDEITTPESFCRDFSERVCAGLVSCDCRFDQRTYDAEHCVDVRTAECVTNIENNIVPDIVAGWARFDEASVAACLSATEVLSQRCVLGTGIGAPLADECNTIVMSTALVGETCELTGEGLAFCGPNGQGICLAGDTAVTCTALPVDGEPCLMDLCAPGLVCNNSTCGAKGGLGAPCETQLACQDGFVCDPTYHCAAPLATGMACDSNVQCQVGLACDQNECTALLDLGDGCTGPEACGTGHSCGRAPETRVCTDPDTAGALCEEDTCATGLVCASSTPRTCVAPPGADESCLDGFHCAEGLTCLFGMDTCEPLAGLGETCTAGVRFCADELGCRESDNTCQEGPGAGEPCYNNPPDYVCGDGLGCDFGLEGSICVPFTGAGSPCNTDRTCSADTYCDYWTMTCKTRLLDGESCKYGNECLAGHECTPEPSGVTCKPMPIRDQPCFYDCAPGLVCKGAGGECVREFCVIPG